MDIQKTSVTDSGNKQPHVCIVLRSFCVSQPYEDAAMSTHVFFCRCHKFAFPLFPRVPQFKRLLVREHIVTILSVHQTHLKYKSSSKMHKTKLIKRVGNRFLQYAKIFSDRYLFRPVPSNPFRGVLPGTTLVTLVLVKAISPGPSLMPSHWSTPSALRLQRIQTCSVRRCVFFFPETSEFAVWLVSWLSMGLLKWGSFKKSVHVVYRPFTEATEATQTQQDLQFTGLRSLRPNMTNDEGGSCQVWRVPICGMINHCLRLGS